MVAARTIGSGGRRVAAQRLVERLRFFGLAEASHQLGIGHCRHWLVSTGELSNGQWTVGGQQRGKSTGR